MRPPGFSQGIDTVNLTNLYITLTCRYRVSLEALYGIAAPFLGPPRALITSASPSSLKYTSGVIFVIIKLKQKPFKRGDAARIGF